MFHELKNNWKASNNIADDADQSLYDPLRDDIRAETELGYGDVAYFLYKLITKEDSIHATNCIPVVNIEKQQWFLIKKRELLPTPLPPFQILQSLPPFSQGITQPQSNPLDKIAQVWEQEIKRKSKKDDERSKKGWSKLAEVQKDPILLATIRQDMVKPTHVRV